MAGNAGNQAQTPQLGPIAQHLQNGHHPISQLSAQGTPPPFKPRFQWTGFTGKTLWDWLQLLGAITIPIVVVFVSVWYSHDLQIVQEQQQQAAASALDQQRQTTYDTYLDRMSDLITSQNLRGSKPEDEVRALARARTLAALKVLDPLRKGQLLVFLYDAHLIDKNPIVGLWNADLRGADLRGADLRGADLGYADLIDADLRYADLIGADLNSADLNSADLNSVNLNSADLDYAGLYHADLSDADLSDADLSDADLSDADLRGAVLDDADLRGAVLDDADLRGAQGLNDQQLNSVQSLRGATMPDGFIHP